MGKSTEIEQLAVFEGSSEISEVDDKIQSMDFGAKRQDIQDQFMYNYTDQSLHTEDKQIQSTQSDEKAESEIKTVSEEMEEDIVAVEKEKSSKKKKRTRPGRYNKIGKGLTWDSTTISRTALRKMTRYYKNKTKTSEFAKKFTRQQINKITLSQVQGLVQEFCWSEFDYVFSEMGPDSKFLLVKALMPILFIHLHQTQIKVYEHFEFLDSIDFSAIRNAMYKPSIKSTNAFFEAAINAFLFCHYWQQCGKAEMMTVKEKKYASAFFDALLEKSEELGVRIYAGIQNANLRCAFLRKST